MAKYIIEGGIPLKGEVKIPGAKNAGFKLMIASLLSDELSTITNIPYIRDVVAVKNIIENIGPKIEFSDDTIQVSGPVNTWQIPSELGLKSRASFMYIPALIHRFRRAKVPLPVGDKIGERPINWFLDGLVEMGATVNKDENFIDVSAEKLRGAVYRFPKNSHTGTEGLVMAAVLADGTTRIENAASEPEVDDLIAFLNKMGAKIKRTESSIIEIEGVSSLKGTVYEVMPDRNEAVTFSCMALGTKGDIEIEGVNHRHLEAFKKEVGNAGGGWEEKEKNLRVYFDQILKPTNVTTTPYPGFMTDWQSLWVALMTQAQGISTVCETIFENRFGYIPNLQKMGADIETFFPEVSDPETFYNFDWNEKTRSLPHGVRINGSTPFHGGKMEVQDIRAGATLVFAALMAKGISEIFGIEHIERGYEDLAGRLERLGARIRKED